MTAYIENLTLNSFFRTPCAKTRDYTES